MADHGYGSVENVSFIAFAAVLEQPAFKAHAPDAAPNPATPLLGVLYRALKGSITALIAAMNPDNKNPKEFDGPFDTAQRYLKDGISAHLHDPNPDKAHAARALFHALLSGKSGTAQTNLTLEREVDFGRAQSKLAAEAPCAAHIALLGLTDRVKAAHDATEALATAIGLNPGAAALIPRATQQRLALAACRDTFQTAHAAVVMALPHADADLVTHLNAWLAAFEAIPRV